MKNSIGTLVKLKENHFFSNSLDWKPSFKFGVYLGTVEFEDYKIFVFGINKSFPFYGREIEKIYDNR